eukprot:5842367-Amphidinium_carterae.1
MESRERVLEAVKEQRYALWEVDEVWRRDVEVVLTAVQADGRALRSAAEMLKGDREIVLAAVQQNGYALKHATEAMRGEGEATEALRADREIVLSAVQKNGYTLQYATEALRADREVVQAAVQQNEYTLRYAADALLEDPTFATKAKEEFHLLKLTMLSGRSTVVAAKDDENVDYVLDQARERLGLPDDGARMELLRCSGERVPADGTEVEDWPGIQPKAEIS